MEMNLEAPVFAYYVDVSRLPRQRTVLDELAQVLKKSYSNVTFLVVASDFNKVECIYDGITSKYRLKRLYDSLEKLIESEHDISKIKQYIRDLIINDIV